MRKLSMGASSAKNSEIAKGSKKINIKKIISVAAVMALAVAMLTITASAADAVPPAGSAEATYQSVINFFITWLTRIGMLVGLVGAIMFGLAIKNNDAEQKQAGLLTMVAGFIVAAICGAADMFNLFA